MTYKASITLPTGIIHVDKDKVKWIPNGKLEPRWYMSLESAEPIFEALSAQIKLAREL